MVLKIVRRHLNKISLLIVLVTQYIIWIIIIIRLFCLYIYFSYQSMSFILKRLRGPCLTDTSLVTPTGEPRTDSVIIERGGGAETETRVLQPHSHYLKAETHTGLLCNAESLFAFSCSRTSPFYRAAKHTQPFFFTHQRHVSGWLVPAF